MRLAESKRALRAIDFEIVLHLSACRDPVAFDRARSSIAKAQEGARHIVDLDPADAAPSIRTLGDHIDAITQYTDNRAAEKFGGGEGMAADIGKRSATC